MTHQLLPLLLLCAAAVSAALAACLPDQSSALLQLKRGFSFNGRSVSNLTTWAPPADCCSGAWEGVACADRAAGAVTALNLGNLSISGNLDTAALLNLTALVSLDLSHNAFHPAPFPTGLEKLHNLSHLNLSNAGFTGQIPAGISMLTKLVSLDLSVTFFNELPGSSPQLQDPDLRSLIRDLSELRELYLDGVNISAAGIEWCGAVADSVPKLEKLSLVGCALSGPVNASLSVLRSLLVLRLDQNNLSSEVPGFIANFSSLSELRLVSCGLYGSLPGSIFQLRNLTVVDLRYNAMLTGHLPKFPKDSALQSLLLSNTKLDGPLPESIGYLKGLTELRLSNCSFTGPIPPSIGNLTQLVHLDLSSNKLQGSIPSIQSPVIYEILLAHNNLTGSIPSFGDEGLQNLVILDLEDNLLSGPIPASIFSLPALQMLQLSKNILSGPLGEISNASLVLSTVNLTENMLHGEIPKSVFNLSGLKVLLLGSNNFSGTLNLSMFGNLRNLSTLDLSRNSLSIQEGNDSSVSFPMIGTLKLVDCNLKKVPGFLRYQKTISSLDLSVNRITGVIPKWIWSNLGSLTYLNLSYNLITKVEGPISNLSLNSAIILDLHSNRLQGPIPVLPINPLVLDYSNNKFSSFIPPSISSYLNFTIFFSLSNNSLTGGIPMSICQATYLQVLDFSDNHLNGSIPACLINGSNVLNVLNLRNNKLIGTMPQIILPGCALRTINLNNNSIEGIVPKALDNCRRLEVLDLGNNLIFDSFPFWLGNLTELRVLVLRSNRFYGSLCHPPESNASAFSKLQISDLASNNFSGHLSLECFTNLKAMMVKSDVSPPTLGFRYLNYSDQSYYEDMITVTIKGLELTFAKTLTLLTYIDISSNMVEGNIPETIGELESLNMLNMSHNSFVGQIPTALMRLTQLEALDLSSNNLSGEIPTALTNLDFLSFLNLSNNQLVGRIPEGSQFSTFDSRAYSGNKGLCGFPLPNCPSSALPPQSRIEHVTEPSWQSIFVGLGFGTGLAMVIGALAAWGKGRRWFYNHSDMALWVILSPVLRVFACCRNERVWTEDDELMEREEDRKQERRFCVFCTKLEFFNGQMLIHHLECACPLEG